MCTHTCTHTHDKGPTAWTKWYMYFYKRTTTNSHKGILLLLITSVSLAQKMLQQEKKAGSRFSMAGAGLKMLNTDKHKVIMNLWLFNPQEQAIINSSVGFRTFKINIILSTNWLTSNWVIFSCTITWKLVNAIGNRQNLHHKQKLIWKFFRCLK